HEVIRISHHLDTRFGRPMVERIKIEIGQQGADHPALGRPFLGGPLAHFFQDSLLQKCRQQAQNPAIDDFRFHPLEQRLMRDGVKELHAPPPSIGPFLKGSPFPVPVLPSKAIPSPPWRPCTEKVAGSSASSCRAAANLCPLPFGQPWLRLRPPSRQRLLP